MARSMGMIKGAEPIFSGEVRSKLVVEFVPLLVLACELDRFIKVVMMIVRYCFGEGFNKHEPGISRVIGWWYMGRLLSHFFLEVFVFLSYSFRLKLKTMRSW